MAPHLSNIHRNCSIFCITNEIYNVHMNNQNSDFPKCAVATAALVPLQSSVDKGKCAYQGARVSLHTEKASVNHV